MRIFFWMMACDLDALSSWFDPSPPPPEPAPALSPPPLPPPAPPEPEAPIVHPLDTEGPPLELALAYRCAGPLGPGAELPLGEDDDGMPTLSAFTGPACLFERPAAPRECPSCSADPCGLGDGTEPEPDPEPDPEEVRQVAQRRAAAFAIDRQLPEGPRVRVRIRAPGPALLYTQTATDAMFCDPNEEPARESLVLYPLEVTGPSELWLPLPSAPPSSPHRLVGVLTGASPDALRRLVEQAPERMDGRKFEISGLPEGVLHAWTTDDLEQCCCPAC